LNNLLHRVVSMTDQVYEQTWDLLAEVLNEMVWTRDAPPNGRRYIFSRDDQSNYAVLYLLTYNVNTYHPERMRTTHHEAVVPVATYHKAAWTRWVFDRIAAIDLHETCESFLIPDLDACIHCGAHDDPDGDHSCSCPHRDGECDHVSPWLYRPYAPHHGNGEDPYSFWPGGTAEQKAKAPGDD
jgi:hypothetical protein